MRRRDFVLGACAALAAPASAATGRFEHGVLWRVTFRGAAPSHVFGTIHEAAALPAAAAAALDASKTLLVEFMPEGHDRERFFEASLLAGGESLERLLGPEDFARAVEQLAPAGLPRPLISRLKPWAALINLRRSAPADAAALDSEIMARAAGRRMAMFQMEGVEEQIFTFDEAPLESQLALLRHSLAHREELIELAGRTLAAYVERDLARIARLREEFAARHPEIAVHQAVMTRRIVYDRSIVMAYRMQRELRRGGAFAALGALHLHGSRGVLALLEQDGFRGTRVY